MIRHDLIKKIGLKNKFGVENFIYTAKLSFIKFRHCLQFVNVNNINNIRNMFWYCLKRRYLIVIFIDPSMQNPLNQNRIKNVEDSVIFMTLWLSPLLLGKQETCIVPVTFVERPQMKINSLKIQKYKYLFHFWSDKAFKQCFGSISFWFGSGSADPHPWWWIRIRIMIRIRIRGNFWFCESDFPY